MIHEETSVIEDEPEEKAVEYASKVQWYASEMLNACNEYKTQFPILAIDLEEGSVSFPCKNARTTLIVDDITSTLNAIESSQDVESIGKKFESLLKVIRFISKSLIVHFFLQLGEHDCDNGEN